MRVSRQYEGFWPLRPWFLLEGLDSLLDAEDICNPNAEVLVDDHNLSSGEQFVVDEDVHGFASQFVQLHHRPRAELEDLANLAAGPVALAIIDGSCGKAIQIIYL